MCGKTDYGCKVRGREGKSPDYYIRSLSITKWERKWMCEYSWEVSLEAAIL